MGGIEFLDMILPLTLIGVESIGEVGRELGGSGCIGEDGRVGGLELMTVVLVSSGIVELNGT